MIRWPKGSPKHQPFVLRHAGFGVAYMEISGPAPSSGRAREASQMT